MTVSASITDLKSAIKVAIDSAALTAPFALPISVEVADSIADVPPEPSGRRTAADPMQVQIGCGAIAEIARSSTRVLEQGIVGINLTYRYPNNKQATLDSCHLAAQQIRDLLSGFSTNTARVEQILTPNPFDQNQALQGTYSHLLNLDCDILRDLVSLAPPDVTDTTPVMSKTRQAVWDAIDNWPAFSDPTTWARKFKTAADLEELSLHDPGLAELPAIAVTWGPTDPKWWVNIQQQWSQQLFVTFYLPAGWRDVAEWRLVQLMQAFYQCAPVDHPNVSYLRAATGRLPSKSPITLELVALGRAQKLHAWQGQIALTLPINFDPNA